MTTGADTGATSMDLLKDISVPVQISFGRVRMPLQELIQLKAGSLVELDRDVEGEVDVIVNNRIVARGEVVEIEGEYGVRIHTLESGAGARVPRSPDHSDSQEAN
jgi:flagellar motor switch protein FliN